MHSIAKGASPEHGLTTYPSEVSCYMKLFPLTAKRAGHKGFIVGYTKVDDEDYTMLKKIGIKWHVAIAAKGKAPYVRSTTLGKMHRFILKPPKDKQVDHINGDTLDNRKSNLRLCTRFENMANMKKLAKNTSGYKNIEIRKKGVYNVYFNKQNKRIRVGTFYELDIAIQERNKALKKHHGEFARFE